MTAETLASYQRSQEQFRSFRLAHRLREVTRTALSPWTPDQLMMWDQQLEFFLDQTFADGQSLNQARVRVFGVLHGIGVKIVALPETQKALRGYSRRRPDIARDGLVWEEVMLIVEWLLQQGNPQAVQAAVASLIAFDTYGRPGEVLRLRPFCLVRVKKKGTFPIMAVIFHPIELLKPAKNQQFDDTVLIGGSASMRTWLAPLVSCLSRGGQPTDLIFNITTSMWNIWLRQACAALQLPIRRPVAHQLRHGGASLDAALGDPLDKICSRGRWLSVNSCRRYSKHGRYWRRVASLSAAQRRAALLAEKKLKIYFSGLRHFSFDSEYPPTRRN